MTKLALRDDAGAILLATARDMQVDQSLWLTHDLRVWWTDALPAPQPSILLTASEADVGRAKVVAR